MTESTAGILIAEDDKEDRLLITEAVSDSRLSTPVTFVENGEELLDYLRRSENPRNSEHSPRPGIILLDLNMPKKDGREALKEIKDDPSLRTIPVVVLSTSQAEEDIMSSYRNGACGFITKPVSFEELVNIMRVIESYWFRTVVLPLRG
ncbi:MAG: response regulator [Spirochaetota bacterium]